MNRRAALALACLALAACKSSGGGGTTFTLSLSASGPGAVSSSPSGISSCRGSTCTATFNAGTAVTLTATADTSASLTGWTGACSGSQTTCTLTMNADQSVSAQFVASTGNQTLTVSVNGGGTVTSSPSGINCPTGCSASFVTGTQVTLTATPSSGQTFSGWAGACTGTGLCNLTMSSAQSVTASFTGGTSSFALSVTVNGNGSVSSTPAGINCPGTCSASFSGNVTLNATAGSGASFTGWSGDCSGTSTSCSLAMSAARSVTASFGSGASNVLTVSLPGDGGGTVTSTPAGINCTSGSSTGCSHDFGSGTSSVTLSAAADSSSTYGGMGLPGNGTGCNGDNFANNCSFGLNGSGVTVNVYFSGWKIRSPFPNTAQALAVVGSSYLLVGGGGGASTSADGKDWTGHVVPTQATLNAVATNGSGLAVAVGDSGTILTTTDFSAWTAATSGVSQSLKGLAYGNGAFVGVGVSGAIVRSTDGTHWTNTTQGTLDLLAVAYAGSQFVAVGYGGTILTSPDGSAWAARGSSSVTTQFLTAVTYDSTTPQYVAVGNAGTVVTSPTGVTWTKSAATNIPIASALRGVAWSGGTFVAVGDATAGSSNGGAAFTSSDAVTWTAHDSLLWSEQFLGVVHAGTYFYGLGNKASITRSADGATWTQVMVNTGGPGFDVTNNTAAIAYGNGIFVSSGGHEVEVFSSPDGITWTQHFIAGCCGGNFPALAYGSWTTPAAGHAFVYAAQTTIFSSADGTTWSATPAFSHSGYYLTGLTYGGGLFVAVGQNGGTTGAVVTSPDGVTWTDRTASAGVNAILGAVAYGAGKFVAVGKTNAWTSTDGAAWTPQNPQNADWMASIAYGAGLFVAIDGQTGSDTITSPDGVNWTTHHAITLGGFGTSLTFGNGMFLAPSLATSADGITWTAHQTPAGGQLNSAVYGPSGWVGNGVGNSTEFWTHH